MAAVLTYLGGALATLIVTAFVAGLNDDNPDVVDLFVFALLWPISLSLALAYLAGDAIRKAREARQ